MGRNNDDDVFGSLGEGVQDDVPAGYGSGLGGQRPRRSLGDGTKSSARQAQRHHWRHGGETRHSWAGFQTNKIPRRHRDYGDGVMGWCRKHAVALSLAVGVPTLLTGLYALGRAVGYYPHEDQVDQSQVDTTFGSASVIGGLDIQTYDGGVDAHLTANSIASKTTIVCSTVNKKTTCSPETQTIPVTMQVEGLTLYVNGKPVTPSVGDGSSVLPEYAIGATTDRVACPTGEVEAKATVSYPYYGSGFYGLTTQPHDLDVVWNSDGKCKSGYGWRMTNAVPWHADQHPTGSASDHAPSPSSATVPTPTAAVKLERLEPAEFSF